MKGGGREEKNLACIIGFNDRWIRWIGTPIFGIIIPLLFFNIGIEEGWGEFLQLVVVSIIHIWLFWSIDKWVVIGLRMNFPKHSEYLKRILLQLVIVSIITIVLSKVSCYLMSLIPYIRDDSFLPTNKQIYFSSFAITILVMLLYEVMYFFDLWKIGLVDNEKLKNENTKAQLAALKNQVNPHFLFNSLNTLASVIPEDPKLAVLFVEKLSAVYRYILEIKNRELISLEEELNCLESYEFLLKIRFGEKFSIIKNIERNCMNMFIVPMSLQMLIENAVKHNIVSTSNPLEVQINCDNNIVFISNKIKLKNQIHGSTKTGLENISKRYELITGQKITITEMNDVFEVQLPLIKIGEYN